MRLLFSKVPDISCKCSYFPRKRAPLALIICYLPHGGARRGSRAVSRLLLAAFVTCWYSVRYKRPCFALQNMAFCNVKRGLSPCRLPPLAARFAVNAFHLNIMMVQYEADGLSAGRFHGRQTMKCHLTCKFAASIVQAGCNPLPYGQALPLRLAGAPCSPLLNAKPTTGKWRLALINNVKYM